jgi:hypothetical protein
MVETQEQIFDCIRKKYVTLTPEEWVRQHFINFLIDYKGYPKGLIAIEHQVIINGNPQRVDIVTFKRDGKPLLVVECKAPSVALTQDTYSQAARYNLALKANYLIITNGIKHFCSRVDLVRMEFESLTEIPSFNEINML